MAKIIQRIRLAPNIHLLEVHAPDVARKSEAGQFLIVMPDERGERIPLTIADWDEEKGTVSAVFLIAGTSTQKLSLLKAGDDIPVFVGPLGKASEIADFGTVVCAGGCFGIAAIHPIARALKATGNRVITLVDVKSPYLLYWEDKLRKVSDAFHLSTRDGSVDNPNTVANDLAGLLEKEKDVARVFAVGCTQMMASCSEITRPLGIRTMVSLNPIMVDGTGMCGACRVTAGGTTKFACVDGPEFDGHSVDWAELFARRKSYFDDEIRSLCAWEQEIYS